MLRLSKISLGKKVYVCVWRVQCQGRHRQTRQKLTKGRERCGRERVSEEGGRKERHKSDQQTKSHLAEKNRLFSEIMLLENSAWREARQARQLGVKQRPGFHYHQMVLAPPDRTRNWDIESLSQGNPLLCILEVQPASLGGISQKKKNRTEATQGAILPVALSDTQSETCIFLDISWCRLKTLPAGLGLIASFV